MGLQGEAQNAGVDRLKQLVEKTIKSRQVSHHASASKMEVQKNVVGLIKIASMQSTELPRNNIITLRTRELSCRKESTSEAKTPGRCLSQNQRYTVKEEHTNPQPLNEDRKRLNESPEAT